MSSKVSVIMGIYNCEHYLTQSIESILQQTYCNWELIMCDDGSTDNTYKIALKYKKQYPEKIKLLKNDKNLGLNKTLNKCLNLATGVYIARQDGDDISDKTRFEKEVAFLNSNPKYALVGTEMNFFDQKGIWGHTSVTETPNVKDFVKSTPFCHGTIMMRTDVMRELKGYSTEKRFLRVEDYHLWIKLYKKGYIGYNLKEFLYDMRDNKEATKRKSFRNRINEAKLKYYIVNSFSLSTTSYIYIAKPIILIFMPKFVYNLIHKKIRIVNV